MKKLIATIFLVILLAAAAAPKVVGLRVESNLQALVEALNQAPGYQASITRINQDWFGTRADINVGLDTTAAKKAYGDDVADTIGKLSLDIHVEASHGPVLPDGIGWLSWQATVSGDSLRDELEWSGEKPFYSLQSVTGLSGTSILHDSMPAFIFTKKADNTRLTFSGYQGKGHYRGGKYDYAGRAKSLHVSTDKGGVIVSGLALEMDFDGDLLRALQGSLFDSEFNIGIDDLNISNNADGKRAFVKALEVNSLTKVDERGLADVQVTYQAGSFGFDHYSGSDFALAMAVNNISGEFILAYQKLANSLVGKSPAEMKAEVEAFLQEHLLAQLKESPEFQVNSFRFTLPEGGVNSSLNARIEDITELPTKLEDKSFWLKHTRVNANLAVDRKVAEKFSATTVKSRLKANPQLAMTPEEIERLSRNQAGLLLDALVQQGSLNKTTEGFSSSFTLEGGKASINGKVIPLPF